MSELLLTVQPLSQLVLIIEPLSHRFLPGHLEQLRTIVLLASAGRWGLIVRQSGPQLTFSCIYFTLNIRPREFTVNTATGQWHYTRCSSWHGLVRCVMFRLAVALSCGLLLCVPVSGEQPSETVEFPAEDGILITADVYWKDKDDHGLPFICLFHQAGYSRGEYLEIAPRLVELGYNCMAVDARSGSEFGNIRNLTAERCTEAGKQVGNDFMRAYPDIVAALKYARENFADGKLIAWGSSYSASLVFKADADNEGLVDGIISFSPNDMSQWTRAWINKSAETIKHPVFITSARRERIRWKRLSEALGEDQVTTFVPAGAGRHGSSALHKSTRDHQAFWTAVEEFLQEKFPPTSEAKEGESGRSGQPPSENPADAAPVTAIPTASGAPPFASVPGAEGAADEPVADASVSENASGHTSHAPPAGEDPPH